MLNSCIRNATAAHRPVNSSGVAEMNVSLSAVLLPKPVSRSRAERVARRVAGREQHERHHAERDDERAERDGDAEPPRLDEAALDPDHAAASGHQQPELLDGGGARVALADDRALVDHRDAVGEREDLVEVLRDEQHADVSLRRLAQVAVHRLDRGDVEPACRRRDDEHARASLELPREHDLLEVPAGELARRQLRAAAANVVALDQLAPRACGSRAA